jgi:uncharacterized protein (DUF3820 family)
MIHRTWLPVGPYTGRRMTDIPTRELQRRWTRQYGWLRHQAAR